MNKSIILLLLMTIISATGVFAAHQEFSLTTSSNNTLHVGDNDIVFTIIRGSVVEDHYIVDGWNQTVNITSNDIVQWVGSDTVKIITPTGSMSLLNPNSSFTMQQTGVYVIHNLIDENITSTVIVSSMPETRVNFNSFINKLPFSFDSDSVILTSSQRDMHLRINVPMDFYYDTETLKFTYGNQYVNRTYEQQYAITKVESWSIAQDTIPSDIPTKSDSFQSFGLVDFVNTGNTNANLGVQISGNGSAFIVIQSNQTLFRNSHTIFNLQIQVPSMIADGIYVANISIGNAQNRYTKNITITVKDLIEPTINEVTFSSSYYGVPNKVSVVSIDNVETKNVTMKYGSSVLEMKKDQQYFTQNVSFVDPSINHVDFCAKDASGNEVCKTIEMNLTQYPIINLSSQSIQGPSRKYGMYARISLFNISIDPIQPIVLKRTLFTTNIVNDSAPYTMQIVDSNGIAQPILTGNETITISKAGEVFLEIKGDNVSDYTVQFSVSALNCYSYPSTIAVRGKFLSYDVPPDFTINVVGKLITCRGHDTGDALSSYTECDNLKFPIQDDVQNMVVPLSLREKKLNDDNNARILADSERQSLIYKIIFTSLIVISVFSLLYAWWVVKIQPYFRKKISI